MNIAIGILFSLISNNNQQNKHNADINNNRIKKGNVLVHVYTQKYNFFSQSINGNFTLYFGLKQPAKNKSFRSLMSNEYYALVVEQGKACDHM